MSCRIASNEVVLGFESEIERISHGVLLPVALSFNVLGQVALRVTVESS